MMTEEQQDRAALYAFGSLDADEAAAFEREMAANGELRALAAELRETVASLARTAGDALSPLELKARVLAQIAAETRGEHPAAGKVIAGPWRHWVPWSVAALLAISSTVLGFLCWEIAKEGIGQGYRAIDAERRAQSAEAELAISRDNASNSDVLRRVSYCPLEAVPAAQQTGPQAAVLWDAANRRGRLHITKLPAPGEGKDYQLWTVETGIKDPVSAGVVKVGADHSAEIDFQPDGDDGKTPVVAFALSRERAGGVPKNEGPILFLGKLSP